MLARRPEAVELARDGRPRRRPGAPGRPRRRGCWTRGALRPLPTGPSWACPATSRALAAQRCCSAERPRPHRRSTPCCRRHPLGDDVAVGRVRRPPGWAARSSTGWSSRCSAACTPAAPTGSRCAPPCRSCSQAAADERSLLAAARAVRAAAAAARRRGPVFAGSRGGVGRLPARAWPTRCRAAGRRSRPARPSASCAGPAARLGGRRARPDAERCSTPTRSCSPCPAPAGRPAAAADVAGGRGRAGRDRVRVDGARHAGLPGRDVARDLPEGSGFLVPPVDGRRSRPSTFSSHKWRLAPTRPTPTLVVAARLGRPARRGRRACSATTPTRRAVAGATSAALGRSGRAGRQPGSPAGAAACRSTPSATWTGSRGSAPPSATLPGLAVCGAAYDGVGIPACIAARAAAAATRVVQHLGARRRMAAWLRRRRPRLAGKRRSRARPRGPQRRRSATPCGRSSGCRDPLRRRPRPRSPPRSSELFDAARRQGRGRPRHLRRRRRCAPTPTS